MAIAQDASTPAFSSTIGGTNLGSDSLSAGPVTEVSASFSPPTGSLVVVLVSASYSALQSFTTSGLTLSDSHSNTYTRAVANPPGQHSASTLTDQAIFTHYYASAPGSTTITASEAHGDSSNGCAVSILPLVLNGCASNQASAAYATAWNNNALGWQINGDQEVALTTTVTGSWVLLVTCTNNGGSATADSLTTTIQGVSDGKSFDLYFGKKTSPTGTPGLTDLGWANSGAYGGVTALEILPATGTTRPGTATLTGSGTVSAAWRLAASASLSGSGTLSSTPLVYGGGSATLSGTGAMTAGGITFANAGLPLASTVALAPHIAGSAAAQLSGTGVMTGTRAREFRAALSGSGLMTVSGYTAGYSAQLSGSGLATVARVLGIVTAGAARGVVTTPQAWPGSSQVAVSPPGSSQKYWLSTLGIVTALQYSFTCPGGADKLGSTVMVPATYRTSLFNPGWSVRVFRGGHSVWSGKLDEPQPTAQGWNLTATGTGNLGQDYLAIYSSSWPANQPDESVNGAVSRGMPWANAGVGSPAGAWYGQGVDSGAQTITALLNLICTRGGLTWYVSSQPGGLPGDDLNVFPLPTAVNRLLTASSPVARTLGGDTNVIWIRYQASADNTGAGGSAATYGTASVSNAQSVALHGRIETYIDLSDAGVMSSGQAQQVGNYILQVYTRASFAGPFTVHYGDLTTTGGQPVDLGTDQAGTVCRLLLTDFGYGGEVVPGPIQFITGSYIYDDFTQTAQISPLQTLDQSLSGLLGLESTLLQPITAASGGG